MTTRAMGAALGVTVVVGLSMLAGCGGGGGGGGTPPTTKGNISGYVRHLVTHQGVAGLNVYIAGLLTTTQSDGSYAMTDVEDGWPIVVSGTGSDGTSYQMVASAYVAISTPDGDNPQPSISVIGGSPPTPPF
jgi:hypothetical protein